MKFISFFSFVNVRCRWDISPGALGSRVYVHHLNFQYINFLYIFFIVKKRPLYVNFNIPPCGK
jgi:hypothetical protein